MPGRVYALLVGINDYPAPIRSLAGCLNDVDRFHDYLRRQVGEAALAVEVLKDGRATRAGIIDAFRSHLGQAGENDVAVFQFCGHGARWAAAAAFHEFHPDGRDEGLVCADSRPSGYDLADKELAVLVGEVAPRVSQMAVILDCCHSGSGTRGVDAFRGLVPRLTDEVTVERPLDTYLDGHYARLRDAGQALYIPSARHVLMAACERGQLAQELPDPAGVFSATLLEVLEKSGGQLSYADLFVRCRAAVRSRAADQDPQFEAHGRFDARAGFLGRAVTRTPRRYLTWFDAGAWMVEGGAIHGIPARPASPVTLALYPEDGDLAAGTATVAHVGAQTSEVTLDFDSTESARYRAEVTSLPGAPAALPFVGDEQARETVQHALDQDGTVRVSLVDARAPLGVRMEARDGRLTLADARGEVAFIEVAGDAPGRDAAGLAPALKHVLEWRRLIDLQNPGTRLTSSQIEAMFEEAAADGRTVAHDVGGLTMSCLRENDGWRQVRGRFKVRNRTAQPLHVVLAYFSSDYGVHIQRNEPVPPGDGWMTLWGEGPMEFLYLEDGVDESVESFRLLVSTEKVDDFLLAQEDLVRGGVLAMRAIGTVKPPKDPFLRNEWCTRGFDIRLVRQVDRVGPGDACPAGSRIVIKGHPAMTADVALAHAQTTTRGGAPVEPFIGTLADHGVTLVDLGATRGGDQSAVLELTGIRSGESLKERPLQIELHVPLAADEAVLPVVYDGRHVLPAGVARRDDDGVTRVSIDHIPEAEGQRGLGDALRLYFFKTWLGRTRVNQLRRVEYGEDGTARYESAGVSDHVAGARRVLLLVHGIIGDTTGMAAGVRACGLDRHFDAVLAYDYENLSTPIEDTARELKAQLASVGLHGDDGRELTLLVHSMGGLVSRWFVEREGGREIVDHLVMCGTPNAGSPFGRVGEARKIATLLTGLSLNYLPALVPFASGLLVLLNRSKNVTPTLEQMNPESGFMRALNSSQDPGIPYTILAGDVEAYREPTDALFARLVSKIGSSLAFDTLFANEAHDIAVGVDSILGVPAVRRPAPSGLNVACHHMNYFLSEPGRRALASVAW